MPNTPTYARPRDLQHTPIGVLVHAYNSVCLASNKLGPCGPDLEELLADSEEPRPRTFLHPPASEAAIAALDRKVREHGFPDGLPGDVAAFYSVTNGIYVGDDGAANDEIFRPAGLVEIADAAGWICELLPFYKTGVSDIDWPEIKEAVQLGAGGDEGQQLLVPPAMTREAIKVAEKAWEEGGAEKRKQMEEVATAVYGGWEEMKKVEIAVIRVYHWAVETEVFASFKHMLEVYVMDVMDNDNDKDNKDEEDGEDNGEDIGNVDGGGDEGVEAEGNEPEEDAGEMEDEDGSATTQQRRTNRQGNIVLNNLKLIFTGTFDTMDRKTCEQTAKKHGCKLTRKLEDADYIIVGRRAGPKKIEEIRKLDLKTIDEQQFLRLLQGEDPIEGQDPVSVSGSVTKANHTAKTKPPAHTAGKGPAETLQGKKILFTGTLHTMDRKKAKETAEKHGATVSTKLDNIDFIVLGVNAGPKKLAEIEQKTLRTVSEQDFLDMVEGQAADSGKSSASGKKRGQQKDSGPKKATKRQRGGKS